MPLRACTYLIYCISDNEGIMLARIIVQSALVAAMLLFTSCISSSVTDALVCDCEHRTESTFISTTYNARLKDSYFSDAGRQTNKHARSGSMCSELTHQNPYGMTCKISHVNAGE